MKNTLLSTALLVALSCTTNKTSIAQKSAVTNTTEQEIEFKSKIDREESKTILYDLAGDNLKGRQPGTEGYKMASDYVENFLKSNNIKPFFKDSYKDEVTNNGKTSANIVGLIGDYNNTKPHILLGAHLDHLGKSDNPEDDVFNGANDNASGVTAVLQIAKELNKFKFKQNIIIALFTEEENGLIGSKHLAERLKKDSLNLSYMLNFEMIGKTLSTGTDKVYLTGYEKSNLAEVINKLAGKQFAEFLPKAKKFQLFSRSDNYPFYKKFNVPCQTISSFDFKNYNHYHLESDEVTLLDLDNMNNIIKSSSTVIYKMLKKDVNLTIKER